MISGNYVEIPPTEYARAAEFIDAWQDESLPQRQYEIVKNELERFARGERVDPYTALIECWMRMETRAIPTVLDVGASSGYYSKVLQIAGAVIDYYGLDYSSAFVKFGKRLFPGIDLECGDACNMPFPAQSFDVVLHGACIMHLFDFKQAIREAVRVSRRYAIFHRTPVFLGRIETALYEKEAYGRKCIEWRFNEAELLDILKSEGLQLLHTADVFLCLSEGYGHRSYLLKKAEQPEPFASNPNV